MAEGEANRKRVWEALRENAFLAEASDQDVDWLASIAQIVEHKRGDRLYSEGQIAEVIAVILDGHVRSVHEADGRRSVVETLGPGEIVGIISALAESPLETDFEAASPVLAGIIPVTTIRELLISNPTIAINAIKEISRRWSSAVSATKRNRADVVTRVALYLDGLPKIRLGGSAFAVEIPIPRVEVASLLGTTPETLSRAFHTLAEQGLIESHDRMIIVPDGDALLGRESSDAGHKAATCPN